MENIFKYQQNNSSDSKIISSNDDSAILFAENVDNPTIKNFLPSTSTTQSATADYIIYFNANSSELTAVDRSNPQKVIAKLKLPLFNSSDDPEPYRLETHLNKLQGSNLILLTAYSYKSFMIILKVIHFDGFKLKLVDTLSDYLSDLYTYSEFVSNKHRKILCVSNASENISYAIYTYDDTSLSLRKKVKLKSVFGSAKRADAIDLTANGEHLALVDENFVLQTIRVNDNSSVRYKTAIVSDKLECVMVGCKWVECEKKIFFAHLAQGYLCLADAERAVQTESIKTREAYACMDHSLLSENLIAVGDLEGSEVKIFDTRYLRKGQLTAASTGKYAKYTEKIRRVEWDPKNCNFLMVQNSYETSIVDVRRTDKSLLVSEYGLEIGDVTFF